MEADVKQLNKNPLNLSQDEALREALRVAIFVRKRWNPTKRVPGLSGVADLTTETAGELLSLVRAVQEAWFWLVVEEETSAPEPAPFHPKERARFVIRELDAALVFLGEALGEEELARLEKLRSHPERAALLDASLYTFLMGYGEIARSARGKLEALSGDFDVSLIDEASALVGELDEQTSEAAACKQREHTRRQEWYRLLKQMQEKVGQIRRAAAYVYRNHPTVLRQVTSAHQRQRINESRKKTSSK